MNQEGFCEKHGPYDASLGECPYCARERGLPPEPQPLDDELPTDPWGGRGSGAAGGYREEETDFGRARVYDDETVWPGRRGREDADPGKTVVDRAERGEEGMLGFLIVANGIHRGRVHRVHDGATIGRDNAKIRLMDPKVSRPHAKITIEDDQFTLWDFASENGTFVDGERIREATPLKENDVIKIGDTEFVLKILE